jgi:hypothetical protein
VSDEPGAGAAGEEVLHDTESAPPGPADQVPRGWTKEEWDSSLYGSRKARSPWASLNVGKEWIYAVVLAVVLVALLAAILVAR